MKRKPFNIKSFIVRQYKKTPTLVRVGAFLLLSAAILYGVHYFTFSERFLPGEELTQKELRLEVASDEGNRLLIPKIGVEMPLFNSDNESDLLKGGWIYPDTSTPDAGSNTVVFGHRYRFFPPASNTFFHLDKMKSGDEFIVIWNGEAYTYKVLYSKIIEPTDFSVLDSSLNNRLTLITCAPLYSNAQRLVVVSELISR